MKGIGASASGLGLLGLSNSVSANDAGDLQWSINNTVEGNNNVNVSLEVGYYGSDLTQRYIDGEYRERWAHFLEASFTAKDTFFAGGNIFDQRFDTRFNGATEHNLTPTAGSAAWPDPPGGNWGEVLKVILEESITSLNAVANFTKTASEVLDAYQEEDFSTEETERIEFETSYRALTRDECSHSVNFVADQEPGTDGMVDILSGAQDNVNEEVNALMYLYPDSGDLPKPPQYSTTNMDMSDSGTDTPYMDMFDKMSEEELAEHGIQRVPFEQHQRERVSPDGGPSDRDPPKRPIYTTSFDPVVEFEAENGRIANSEVSKY